MSVAYNRFSIEGKMNTLRLLVWFVAIMLVPATVVESFEWRCCFPRGKYFGAYPIENIDAKGIVQLEGTWVTEGLCVVGTLDAECARIGCARVNGCAFLTNTTIDWDICINGKADLKCSNFQGVTEICGVVEAFNCIFEDILQIESSYVELNACSVEDLYIFRNSNCDCGPLQIVKIAHGTNVEGDIVFESGCGRVFLDRCSTISGAIYGGFITYVGD